MRDVVDESCRYGIVGVAGFARIVGLDVASADEAILVAVALRASQAFQIAAGMEKETMAAHQGKEDAVRGTVFVQGKSSQTVEGEWHFGAHFLDGDGVGDGLYLYYRIVEFRDGRLGQVELHLVGHSALQRFAQPVIAQHAPFGMFQGEGLGSLWQIKPDFAHSVLSLHDAERGGEGKVGWCHHLDQGAGFIVQVTHIVDKGAHVVGQLAETSHRKLLCPKGRRNG